MRIQRMLMIGITVLLPLIGACSGSDSKTETAKTPKLSDCDYAKRVETIIDTFRTNVGDAAQNLDEGTASSGGKDLVTKAINSLDQELGKAISDIKALNVEGEIAKVNGELTGGLEDFRKRLPEATKAAGNGEFDKIEPILEQAGEDFSNRFTDLSTKYPDATKRLSACE